MVSTCDGGSAIDRNQRRYGALVFGLYVVGIAGMIVGILLDYALAASVVYLTGLWGGFALSLWLHHGSSIQMADERDREIERRASDYTMLGVIGFTIGVLPVVLVLEFTADYSFGSTVDGILYAFTAICVLYVASFFFTWHRS